MSDFLDSYSGQGYEDFSANSYQVPFLKIAQKLSPELNTHNESCIKGLEVGQFFNSLTKKNYGSSIKLIPLRQREVWLEYEPNRGPFRGMHEVGSIQTTGDVFDGGLKTLAGNDIIDALVFYCLLADEPASGPIIFTMYGTGFRHGKTWNSLIMTSKTSSGKQAPYFGSVWTLETIYNTDGKNDWYQIGSKTSSNIKRERSITQEELTTYILPARAILKDISRQADYAQVTGTPDRKALPESSDGTVHSDF